MRVLADYNVPIIYGLRSGHVSRSNITLPLGVQAELNASDISAQLRILEASVQIS
jgi:muramoyltetrapeptide carboxypeptidase